MSLKLFVGGAIVPFELRQFPAGETFLRLGYMPPAWGLSIKLNYESNSDLIDLALLVDALRREYGSEVEIILVMPYMPYARQDRVCSPGESLSLKVVADFINSLGFTEVVCYDLHSNVAEALINNLVHRPATEKIASLLEWLDHDTTVLVSPDAGANKKVLGIAKDHGFAHVVRADKTRDVLTGKVTGTAVYSEHVGNKDFLIVDDICDGGRTFTELAKELRKLTDGQVMLYVTHGIFSAGVEVFDGLVDKLYTSNPVGAKGEAAVASGKVSLVI